MSNTAQDVDGFKAILASDMSDGAKLAAIAELLGAASATEIAAALNKSIRTVERHYAELRKVRKSAGTRNCVDTQICVPEARKSAESATQICVESSRAPASIDSRATKELPSEVLCEVNNITPHSAPQAEKRASKTKRGARLPDAWTLPEDWRQWTLVNCPAATQDAVRTEALKFANYWQAQPGAKACKLDWRKTWQNWSLTAFSRAPLRPTASGYQSGAQPFQTAAERERQRQRELLAKLDAKIASEAAPL